MRNKRNKYSFKLLSSKQKSYLLIIAFLAVIVQGIFLSSSFVVKKNRQIYTAELYGENLTKNISLLITQAIYPTEVVKNMYLQYGDLVFQSFGDMCKRFMEDDPVISSLYIAPDAVIQVAYPPEAAASTIGFKMLEDSEQSEKAYLALETGKPTVAGPHNLVEGGVGFIVRNPVYVDGEFKAFTIAVLNWEGFVEQILNRIDTTGSKFRFGVWKEDSSHIVTDEYGYIFRDSSRNISRVIDIDVPLPNDLWHLSVEPEEGWIGISSVWIETLISGLIVALILVLVYFHLCDTANRINSLKYDPLTGLLTRMSLYDYIRQLRRNDPNGSYDIIVADIENFKVANGIYGTKTCDNFLKFLAKRYSAENEFAKVARYGGDQFIIIFPSSTNMGKEAFEKQAIELQEQSPLKNINIKYGFYGHIDFKLPVSIICDRALIAAKSILHNCDEIVANWDGEISQQSAKEQMVESSFQNAIDNEEFKVWFQPKFDAKTEKVIGSEALVRWIKKDGTIVSPLDFIYVFEEDGLIVQLDEYVFRKVCATLKYLIEDDNPVFPVSVNLSRTSLAHKNTVSNYAEIVKEYGIPINLVPLEITETTKTRDLAIKEIVEDFKSYGFEIHMDDFGSGLSSMESLNILPFDVVKLDKSLIDYIGDPGGNELIRHCIELAHFKSLKVVAEGVEKKEQLDFLRELNCDYIQGYYYSAPLSYEDSLLFFMKLYRENRT